MLVATPAELVVGAKGQQRVAAAVEWNFLVASDVALYLSSLLEHVQLLNALNSVSETQSTSIQFCRQVKLHAALAWCCREVCLARHTAGESTILASLQHTNTPEPTVCTT